ncbi:YozQ family protein [Brevibacillus borstelensis]|uniref:YozQ family protein n=1 Tax=Brevibacillus borstelensis TaxID=45462 RepID=UPI0030C22B94
MDNNNDGLHNDGLQNTASDIADKMYEPSDYKSNSFTEKGLALTHEQVSDDYMEGTNDGKIDANAGEESVDLPRTGYENMFRET